MRPQKLFMSSDTYIQNEQEAPILSYLRYCVLFCHRYYLCYGQISDLWCCLSEADLYKIYCFPLINQPRFQILLFIFKSIMARAKRKAPPKKRERKAVSRLTYDETHLLNSKKIKTCRNRKKWTQENQQKAKQKRAKQQNNKIGKNVSGTKLQGAKHAKKKEQNKSNKKK